GFVKLTATAGSAGYFASLGVPSPTVMTIIVGIVELVAGIAVLVGFGTRIAAYVLAAFCIVSALVAHMDWSSGMQWIQFQKNVTLAGGFLVLAVLGAGQLSIDARRGAPVSA